MTQHFWRGLIPSPSSYYSVRTHPTNHCAHPLVGSLHAASSISTWLPSSEQLWRAKRVPSIVTNSSKCTIIHEQQANCLHPDRSNSNCCSRHEIQIPRSEGEDNLRRRTARQTHKKDPAQSGRTARRPTPVTRRRQKNTSKHGCGGGVWCVSVLLPTLLPLFDPEIILQP